MTIVDVEMVPERVSATHAADWLLARGRGAVALAELARLLGVPEDQVRRRLHAPARRGEWVSPVRGLWVPVPAEYRTWGAPPGPEIIGRMMDHLDVRYYVGWLSAAQLHGAAHQQPQVFQVATSRYVQDRQVGRTRFQFHQRPDGVDLPTVTRRAGPTQVVISTPEVTALDLAADPALGAGIDNVATVIIELAAETDLDLDALARIAPRFPTAAGRRIGHILETHADVRADQLHDVVTQATPTPSRLDPAGSTTGPVDERWFLYLNHDLEPEA